MNILRYAQGNNHQFLRFRPFLKNFLSVFVQPDINLYLLDFMNPLLQLINDSDGKLKKVEGHMIQRIYYILSECCETLELALEPVLPFMVPILLAVIRSNTKVHHRELAISVLGQAGKLKKFDHNHRHSCENFISNDFVLAVATKKAFREYFSSVLEVLRPFLVDNLPDEQLPLQVQTFGRWYYRFRETEEFFYIVVSVSSDTLGTLFKSLYMKGDDFQLMIDVLDLTLAITEQKNCGELRAGLYSMLSDCSEVMKEKMAAYIERILKLMVISFKSKDIYVSLSSFLALYL